MRAEKQGSYAEPLDKTQKPACGIVTRSYSRGRDFFFEARKSCFLCRYRLKKKKKRNFRRKNKAEKFTVKRSVGAVRGGLELVVEVVHVVEPIRGVESVLRQGMTSA